MALAGKGWPAMIAHLADATDRAARLVGVHGGVLASSDGSDAGMPAGDVASLFGEGADEVAVCTDGFKARAATLHAGPRRVGVLLLEEPAEVELLAAATVALSIEAVRRDADARARAESASRLIDEIRYGSLRDPDEISRAAERFGLVLHRPHAAAVFAYDGPNARTWATALSWIEMPSRQEEGLGWTVLTGDVEAELRRIRTRLQGMVGTDAPVLAAAGPVVTGVRDTARSFYEAQIVLALLRRDGGRSRELTHAALGVGGLLLSVAPDRLRTFVGQQLGPLLDRPDLLETLDAWLATNGSRAAVAHRLNMHRNSVGYRIGRARELLGVDPLDPAATLHLQAALVARRLLDAVEEAGLGPRLTEDESGLEPPLTPEPGR